MTPDDRGSLLISAIRYALGRRTYVVSDTCRIARMALHETTDETRAIIGRDIRMALARGQCGDDIDDREWRALLYWMGELARPEHPTALAVERALEGAAPRQSKAE